MNKQRGYAELFIAVGSLVVLLIVMFWMDSAACHSKWERSGMAGVTWGPVQGCLVKLPDGRWLPEERIREVDIPKAR